MAQRESDREDLLREATALVPRVELQLAEFPEPVVAGFRRNGCASFFFGHEPVIQFNSRGELRRLYQGGRLIKAVSGGLHGLTRERTGNSVVLRSRPFTAQETRETIESVERQLAILSSSLGAGSARCLGQVPADGDALARLRKWLADRQVPVAIASEPHAR